jgi:hypothetical protein
MSVDRNVVGRVGENQIGTRTVKQAIEPLTMARVAARQAMPAEPPEVAPAGWWPSADR